MIQLENRIAVVTGGGSGIGEATAILLAERGASVAVAGRGMEKLAAVVARIEAGGGRAVAVPVDVGIEDSVRAMFADVADRLGPADILIANAALTDPAFMARDGMVGELDVEVWNRTIDVNLRGAMLCAKHAIPQMEQAGKGAIVFSSSGKGLAGDFDHFTYGVAKAGLNNLMRNVATQYGKLGIRANCVSIGMVLSDALRASFPPSLLRMFEEHHLTPYLGEPRHVAEVIAFLASDAAAFMTGALVPVDGGVMAHSPLYADVLRMRRSEMQEH